MNILTEQKKKLIEQLLGKKTNGIDLKYAIKQLEKRMKWVIHE